MHVQVYGDIPAVAYDLQEDDLLTHIWQPDVAYPARHYLPGSLMDPSFQDIKTFQQDCQVQAMYPMRQNMTYDYSFVPHSPPQGMQAWYPYNPGQDTTRGLHSSWSAPQLQRLPQIQLVDDLSPGDSSGSPSDSNWSPRLSIGPLSSHPAEFDDNGPATPLSNYHGEWMPIPHQSHSRNPSLGSPMSQPVAMKDLQHDYDLDAHNPCPQEEDLHQHLNIQPALKRLMVVEDAAEEAEEYDPTDDGQDSEFVPSGRELRRMAPIRRQSRSNNASSSTLPRPNNINRVTKAKSHRRRSKAPNADSLIQTADKRRFTCSFFHYGCPGTFVSKNEWKRHISSQHLQLGFYRCDLGGCNPHLGQKPTPDTLHSHDEADHPFEQNQELVYNDFNRKDLFTQHLRRMHVPWSSTPSPSATRKSSSHTQSHQRPPSAAAKAEFEASLDSHRQRCYRLRRHPPQRSVCGFCSRVFEGETAWEERMEHVGRHWERGDGIMDAIEGDDGTVRKGVVEDEDDELTSWALEEEIIREGEYGYELA